MGAFRKLLTPLKKEKIRLEGVDKCRRPPSTFVDSLSRLAHLTGFREILRAKPALWPPHRHAGLLSEPTQTRAGRRLEHDEFRSSSDQPCGRKGLHGTFGQRSELFLQCFVILKGAQPHEIGSIGTDG